MKNFILSAIICSSLFNASTYAQQTSGGTVSTTPVPKTGDAGKSTEKEISAEVNAGKSDIFLDNNSLTIEIKTWNQPKVRISTKVYIDVASTLTNEQWLERLNLTVKQAGGNVRITSRPISSDSVTYTSDGNISSTTRSSGSSNGMAIFNAEGRNIGTLQNNIGTLQNAKRTVTVFIPEGNKLEIDNQFGKLELISNLQNVTIKSTNGSIEAGDINRLIMRSKFTPFVVGNVKDAEIEMSNGRLKAGNIDKLDIDSKFSTIDIASVGDIILRSSNDNYEIENVGDLKGRKTFGNLRIDNLKTSIDIEGANADIKVKNLNPSVEAININNKFGDIRLPLNNIKNYEVKVIGEFNTVYAPFEKKPLADTAHKSASVSGVGAQTYGNAGSDGRSDVSYSSATDANGFIAEVGNIKGKHTTFIINCTSCTVDFK